MAPARGNDSHIVATPVEVAEEDTGDERRMPPHEPGVAVEIPAADEPVGVQEEERVVGPGIAELGDLVHGVTGGAVEGGEVS